MATTSVPRQPPGRPSFSGSITFGLVAVPVRLHPALESHHGPVLHLVHSEDGSRVRSRRWCEAEDREVPLEEVARGWESPDGRMVVLTDEDMAELPVPSKRIIDVLAFIPASEVDPLLLDTPYYVDVAEKAPPKPYLLLRDVMADSGLVAITKITLRERESLAILRVVDDLIVLQTMRWPDEVRPTTGIKAPSTEAMRIHTNEIEMVLKLAASIGEGYDLDAERDSYVTALDQLLAAKAAGGEAEHILEPAAAPSPSALDLMEALRTSIEKSQAERAAAEQAKKSRSKKPTKRTPRRAS